MKLTREQRAAFFAAMRGERGWPALVGQGKPPVLESGERYHVTSRVAIEFRRAPRIKRGGGWILRYPEDYKVIDFRDENFYLMPTSHTVAVDEHGRPLPMPPEEEIGYTKNPMRARVDPLRAVPPNLNNVYSMRSRLEHAKRPVAGTERAQERAVKEEIHKAMGALDPVGRALLLAGIKRVIEEAQQEQEAA